MTKKRVMKKFDLKVGRGVSGKGVFAKNDIPKNSRIIEYIGKEVKKEDIEKTEGRYLFWTGKNKMINGNVPENTARYINHSCKPNCKAEGPEGKIYIISKRNIKAGEEINYNYGKEYFDKYIKPKGCKCTKCTSTK